MVVDQRANNDRLSIDQVSNTGVSNAYVTCLAGNLGLYQGNPQAALDVTGNVRVQGNLVAQTATLGSLLCSNIVGLPAAANVVDIAGNSFNYLIGNVASLGVGTGTPAMSLDVVGNTRVQRVATGAYRPAGLRLENTSTTAPIGLTMDFATQFSGLAQPQKVAAQIVGEPDAGTGGRIGFSTANTTGVLNQTLSINASGLTTAPQFAATSANIVSLGAGTIYCSNLQGISTVANVTDLVGNSLQYAAANVGTLALYGSSPYISIKGPSDPGDQISKMYSTVGDRYGFGSYNSGMVRAFTSVTYPYGQVALSLASTDTTAATATTFQDLLTACKGNVTAWRPFFATSANISSVAANVCNIQNLGATAANIVSLGANTIYCSNFPNLVIPPQQSLQDISGNSVSYSTGTFAKQLTANVSNVQTLGATAANIVSLGANTIYCSNFPNLVIPPQQSLQDISGNSVSYNAATFSKQLTANVSNVQLLGATAANIVSLGANTIYCSNFPNLIIPPQQSLQDISGNSVTYGTGIFGNLRVQQQINANICNLTGNLYAVAGQFTGNVSTTGAVAAPTVVCGNVAGDMITKTFASAADRYGIGAYSPGVMRAFSSGTIPSTVNLSVATDGNQGFQDILAAGQSSVVINRPLYLPNGNVSISGTNPICLGYDVAGKELSAGKIGYGNFSNYNSLDVVGAGTSIGQRRVQVFDNLIINGSGPGAGNLYAVNGQFTGGLNVSGNVSLPSLTVTANVASNLAVSGLLQPYQQISMPANNLGDWMSGYLRMASSATVTASDSTPMARCVRSPAACTIRPPCTSAWPHRTAPAGSVPSPTSCLHQMPP